MAKMLDEETWATRTLNSVERAGSELILGGKNEWMNWIKSNQLLTAADHTIFQPFLMSLLSESETDPTEQTS